MITLLAATLVGFGGASAPLAPAPLPTCQFEDGNADGQPCTWTDPDTGVGFFVTSENYR